MAERLTFTLEGRDDLSRVLGHAGDSADRLRAQMVDAADGSGRAILQLEQDSNGILRDLEGNFLSAGDAAALMAHRAEESSRSMTTWGEAAEAAGKAGDALKKSLLTLAPAAIPMAASLAPLAASTLAAGVGMAALGVAAGRQVAAMSEAAEAEQKYTDAVEQSGARSAEAVKAQMAYAKQMAQLPPATREAAAALSVMKDSYADWSDSLATDTTGPLVKGMATLQGIFPKLTPTVKGAAEQLDRLMTLAAGGVASPGFDGFMTKVDKWSTGALTRATDGLVKLLRTAETGEMSGGLSDFMAWAREQGPAVSATLQDVGRALLHVLDAGAEVGVGMLSVVQALAQLVAAVPPELITTMLQLAIAIRAVTLAAAGAAAIRTAIAALGTSLVAMRVAAAAAPGPLAAAGAAITTLSRTAKLALVGTGIGVLALVIGEIAAAGEEAPIDVDKMTSSLAKLGDTGKLTGTALQEFGAGFGDLGKTIGEVIDPSIMESVDNWLADLPGGFFDAGVATEKFTQQSDAIDKSLASLVNGGKADLAAAALKNMMGSMDAEKAAKLRGSLDEYDGALGNVAFEARLAAEGQGLFGAQAQETQAKLDAQKASADGLRQSLQALNDVNRAGISAQVAFEAALDSTQEAAEKNAGAFGVNAREIDLNTEKGRTAASALTDLAAKTDAAAGAARESGASWETVNGIYKKGRDQLVENATQMGLNETAAERLADQILKTPDKTAKLKGNIDDLEAKLSSAKTQLGRVPDARKAQVRANISQLEVQLAEARRKLDMLDGKTAVTYVTTVYSSDRVVSPDGHAGPGGFPKYARGTDSAASGWALVGEEGPELVRMKGGERVFDHATSKKMAAAMGDLPGLSLGRQVGAGLSVGMVQSTAGVEAAARQMAAGVEAGVRSELQIHSPSQRMLDLMKDVRDGIVRGLTGSRDEIRATSRSLADEIWAAFEGKKTDKDKVLVRMVSETNDRLLRLATRRDSLKRQLSSAQDLLETRIAARDQLRISARTAAQNASSLSSLGLEPREVTASSIRVGLQQKLAKLRQFRRYVENLAKRGLNRNLMRQILLMGPDEGYAYASALAGMSTADFKQINSLQREIDTEADTVGKVGSNALYGAGVASAQGLVAGLKSQVGAVEQQMTEIAKAMERAIKKALGIKSPSRVAHGIGLNFGQGLSGGTRASLPLVGRAVDAVAERMAGIRPIPGQPMAGLGAGPAAVPQQINHFHLDNAIDPIRVGQEIQRVLLGLKRTNGGSTGLDLG